MSEKKSLSATFIFLAGTLCVITIAGFTYIVLNNSGIEIPGFLRNVKNETIIDTTEQAAAQNDTETEQVVKPYGTQIRGTVIDAKNLTISVRRAQEEPQEIKITYTNSTIVTELSSAPPKPGEKNSAIQTEINPATLAVGDIITVESAEQITATATDVTAIKIIKLI